MKGIGDWIFSQILSKSLVSSRSLSGGSFFNEGHPNEEFDEQSPTHTASLVPEEVPPNASSSCTTNVDNQTNLSSLEAQVENSSQLHHDINGKRADSLAQIEDLQVKFLRIVQRFSQSQDNLLVAKVLYRLYLATLIRAGESDLKRVNLRNDRAKIVAREQEATGLPELDFSLRILVLGKTGVGKSATINSIFDQSKTQTDAFRPATDRIQEVSGSVGGIRITFIDTPGFFPSCTSNMRRNRKIMLSVKRFIRKSPPDVVLYFERLDLINMGYSDFPLLKLITEVFGTAIWFNTIIVMTHASSTLPERPYGIPVSYDSYVDRCTDVVQHYIHQAVSDNKLENPVLLVENHPQCKKNFTGEAILPNGQAWKSQFMLFCMCTKVLGDANTLLKFRDSIELGPLSSNRLPSLPHLLSSLLRHRSFSSPVEAEDEIDKILLSDMNEEDEYDQLPSIRILTKSQFDRLSKLQKKAYLDELDYRETLYLKKQMKEESQRRKESRFSESSDSTFDDEASPEAVPLPDMAVPPSFDSNCPVHRYRYLVTSDQWLARPVLDPHGWDHDVGFDGINLETAVEVRRNTFASITGQMSKDKKDFSIQSECAAAFVDPTGHTYSIGVDVQSSGNDMFYTIHNSTKLSKIKQNVADIGVSLTSFRNKCYFGAKVEDTIVVGKRLKLVMNAGRMGIPGNAAYGGSFEATLRGKDYPVRNDHASLTMTALSYDKEIVVSGGFQSEFRPMLGTRVSISGSLNNINRGQICIKLSSFEHLEVAALAVLSVIKALSQRKARDKKSQGEALEEG